MQFTALDPAQRVPPVVAHSSWQTTQAAVSPQRETQSASFWQGTQWALVKQKALFPVVVKQLPSRPSALVQGTFAPSPQMSGDCPAWHVLWSCPWHFFLPFLPRQIPEQHWPAFLQNLPTSTQPN